MNDARRNLIVEVSEATTDYVSRLRTIDDVGDISAELGRVTKHLGFDVFVLGQMPTVGYEGSNFYTPTIPKRLRATSTTASGSATILSSTP